MACSRVTFTLPRLLYINFITLFNSSVVSSGVYKAANISIMGSALFWDITRRRVVIVNRRFGTKCRSHIHGSRVYYGVILCDIVYFDK
jgi:hypothetical protein